MSSDKPDQVSQFNLKELREIAASGGAERPEKGDVPVRPQRRAGSFVDDAESLLSDIRNTVDAEIADETEKYRKKKAEQRDRETAERDALKERRSIEIQARLEAEARRQQAAADEREHWAHQAEMEERRARGEIIDEPEVPAMQPTAPAPTAPVTPEPKRSGTGIYIAVVGLLLLGVIIVGVMMLQPTEPLKPTVAKGTATATTGTVASSGLPKAPSVPAAVIPQVDAALADVGTADASVPDIGVPDAQVKPKKKRAKPAKRRKARTKRKAKKKVKKAKKSEKKFNIQLDGDDGITF